MSSLQCWSSAVVIFTLRTLHSSPQLRSCWKPSLVQVLRQLLLDRHRAFPAASTTARLERVSHDFACQKITKLAYVSNPLSLAPPPPPLVLQPLDDSTVLELVSSRYLNAVIMFVRRLSWVVTTHSESICRFLILEPICVFFVPCSLMVMSHMTIAKAVSDVYSCTEETPGRFVLADNPDIICFTGEWNSFYRVVSIMVGIVWVAGLPVATAILARKAAHGVNESNVGDSS
jgi:hypothetical protein